MGKAFLSLIGRVPYNRAANRYMPIDQGIRDITISYREMGDATLDKGLLCNPILFERVLLSDEKESLALRL